jgi:hypothetical protein
MVWCGPVRGGSSVFFQDPTHTLHHIVWGTHFRNEDHTLLRDLRQIAGWYGSVTAGRFH